MSEDLKAKAAAMVSGWTTGNAAAMTAVLHEDARWIAPQSSVEAGFPVPLIGRDEIVGVISRAGTGYEYLNATIEQVIQEGSTVAMRVVLDGKRRSNGALYNNRYLFMINFVDGLAAEIYEMTDTNYIFKIRALAPAT